MDNSVALDEATGLVRQKCSERSGGSRGFGLGRGSYCSCMSDHALIKRSDPHQSSWEQRSWKGLFMAPTLWLVKGL